MTLYGMVESGIYNIGQLSIVSTLRPVRLPLPLLPPCAVSDSVRVEPSVRAGIAVHGVCEASAARLPEPPRRLRLRLHPRSRRARLHRSPCHPRPRLGTLHVRAVRTRGAGTDAG